MNVPGAAEALATGTRAQRRASAAYTRIATAWGELYLDGQVPAFFRSAL
jgi:hypothetical protein